MASNSKDAEDDDEVADILLDERTKAYNNYYRRIMGTDRRKSLFDLAFSHLFCYRSTPYNHFEVIFNLLYFHKHDEYYWIRRDPDPLPLD